MKLTRRTYINAIMFVLFVPLRKVPIPTQVLVLCETERNEKHLIYLRVMFFRNSYLIIVYAGMYNNVRCGEIKQSNLNSKNQYNHNSKLNELCI